MFPFVKLYKIKEVIIPGPTQFVAGELPRVWVYAAYDVALIKGSYANKKTVGYTKDIETAKRYLLESAEGEQRTVRLVQAYELPDGGLCMMNAVTRLPELK